MNKVINQVLPKDWKLTTLKKITQLIDKVKPANEPDSEILYLDIGGIDKNTNTVIDFKHYIGKNAPSRAQQRIKKGDVAFANVRPYLRNIAIVPKELDEQVGSTGFCFLRPVDGISNKYIYYWVLSNAFINDITKFQKGSSYPAVTNKQILDRNIPLAPYDQQQQIVAKIEELFSHIDAGVVALQKAKQLLKQYRQSVLKAAVTGELTREWREQNKDKIEPASELLKRILAERRSKWEEQQLEQFKAQGKVPKDDKWKKNYKEPVAYDFNGELPKIPKEWIWVSPEQIAHTDDYSLAIGPFGSNLKVSDYKDGGVPLVFVRNIRTHYYGQVNAKYVSPEKAQELHAHSIKGGDLLITKMGEPPGEASIYPQNNNEIAIITADCIKWRLSSEIKCSSLFVHTINSSFLRDQIVDRTKGVAQKKISLGTFKTLAFPLPPLEEQQEILNLVDQKLIANERLTKSINARLIQAERHKQSILSFAFSGNL